MSNDGYYVVYTNLLWFKQEFKVLSFYRGGIICNNCIYWDDLFRLL